MRFQHKLDCALNNLFEEEFDDQALAAKAKEQAGTGLTKENPSELAKKKQKQQEELRKKEELDRLDKDILIAQNKASAGTADPNEIKKFSDLVRARSEFAKQMEN